MRRLRIGTRGSELARRQAQIVGDALCRLHPAIECEMVIIKTESDLHPARAIGEGWPIGSFTSAIERALLAGEIDCAVHSYKDLPTIETPELVIAAVPPREAVHDVLVSARPMVMSNWPRGMTIGTSSPRRAAQLRRETDVNIVPIRGNVPTRVGMVGREVDAVVLAAAGLRRLGIEPEHSIDLPLDRFLPAPGQGALAVQARADDDDVLAMLRPLNHESTSTAVKAEREFLRQIGAGCHRPVAALAVIEGGVMKLHGQLFSDDGVYVFEGEESGLDAVEAGRTLAERLRAKLCEIQSRESEPGGR